VDKFNFEQLMNIEVPDECIKKALKIPAVHKKTVFSVRFFRFAAGLAACVVIAAAVIFSAMFGVNKNVNLINPDDGARSAPSIIGTVPDSTDYTNPEKPTSDLSAGDSKNHSRVTEPAENGELIYEEKGAENTDKTKETEAKADTKPSKENIKQNVKQNVKQN
jgi:hypothetical protein